MGGSMRQKGYRAHAERRNLDAGALRQAGLSGHHASCAEGLFRPIADAGMAHESLVQKAYEFSSGRRRRRCHRSLFQHPCLARTERRAGRTRALPRLRLPARAGGAAVSRRDPRRSHRRSDPGSGAHALVAIFLPCDVARLGAPLAADAASRLARPAGADQARGGGAGRRSASLHGQSAIFQGRAGVAPAIRQGGGMSDDAGMTGHIGPTIGRYVHVEIGGEMHRVYFEENGKGIPLVCLHTAGSDARQWRHLLADEELARDFRIIAFDMPFHGKSNPPESWGGEEYRLTTARYTETIRAFCRTLRLEKPVVMGCSIGGRIVLNLAIDHADEF